jgi:hypothetical protein
LPAAAASAPSLTGIISRCHGRARLLLFAGGKSQGFDRYTTVSVNAVTFARMITHPGRPVEESTEDIAQVNIVEFVATVREQLLLEASVHGYDAEISEPVRDADLDGAGRYGWMLRINRARVSVLMPGVELARTRREESTPACPHINGRPLP